MKRREVLEGVAAGWGLAGPTVASGGSRLSGPPARAGRRDRVRNRSATQQRDDPTSVRSIAEWADSDKPARRLFGNGPPFDDDRPDPYDRSGLSYPMVTVDTDPRSQDPPKSRVVSGPIDVGQLHGKVTYGGVRYLDTVSVGPSIPNGTVNYPGDPAGSDRTMYLYNLFFADYNAYDLGMVNRTVDRDRSPDNDTLADGYTDKGVIESHRWIDPADRVFRTARQPQQQPGSSGGPARPTPEYRSLRNVVDRHREGVTHRVLWQNVKLPLAVPGEWGPTERGYRRARARAWGEHIGHAGADVVGMCELNSDDLLTRVKRGYDAWYPDTDRQWEKKDLGVLVGKRSDDDASVQRNVVHTEGKQFDNGGPAVAGTSKEGWMRAVVEVPPLPGNPKFEVFVTHLQPVFESAGTVGSANEDAKLAAKISQMRELRDEIAERNDEKPSQPKIVMGDFNIQSASRGSLLQDDSGVRNGQYFSNFMQQMDSVGMQDAWLTHGGPGPANSDCTFQSDYVCDPFDPTPNRGDANTTDGQRRSYYQGNRLDYVFVEKPKPDHDLHLDVSRVKNVVFDDSRFGQLSDHVGVAFDLLTSPAD